MVCAKGCVYVGVLAQIRNEFLKFKSRSSPLLNIVIHITDQFWRTQTGSFSHRTVLQNKRHHVAAAHGGSAHGTRLGLDPCPHVCSVHADPQHCFPLCIHTYCAVSSH